MIKTKKWLLAVSIALVGMIVSLLISFFPSIVEAKAETKYFSAEQYTEDDGLLQEDGSHSLTRRIKDFAEDVKSGYNGQAFPELAQVVPLEYLETTEDDAEFSYNGKEYGFYMAKEGNYFDILLIDFIYEFDDVGHTNNEYKIRIEPILQQRFYRTGTAANYQWQKTTNYYKYYVSNPRFLTVARNENDLNYGDTGYSKLTDNGVIIQQTRLNYSKTLYKTEEDLWETCFEFLGDKLLSTATDAAVDFLDKYTYGLASLVKDLYDFNKTLYEEGQEVEVEANNEANIFTQQSKTEQRNGPLDGYSRVVTFIPADEIVLAAAEDTAENINDNSYAEFITVLNDTNYRTRLNQYCEFDIVRRAGLYSSMEEVNDPDIEAYSFTKERILFSEGSEKELEFDKSATAYNLPNGTDSFVFTPVVSGTYTFKADDSNARLSLYPAADKDDIKFSGKSVGSAYLQGGTIYLLEAGMSGENSGRYFVNATVGVWNSETKKENQPIPAGGQLYKLAARERGGYQISSSNSNIRYRLYNSNMQYMYESESNLFSQYLAPGQAYYLYVYSINNTAQTATLSFSAVEEIKEGEEYDISVNYPIMYKFTAPDGLGKATYYSVIFKDMADDFTGKIFGSSNSINYMSSDGFQSMSLYLESGEDIYIQMSSSSPFTLKIDKAEDLFTWVIDTEEQETNTVCLQRGDKYTIGLKIDGVEVDKAIYSSDLALSAGNILDLTEYPYITNPAEDSTYLYFYAIENNTPAPLMVCVTHNFEFEFDKYSNNTSYGFKWETISTDSSEYFIINYTVEAGGITSVRETSYIRSGSSQSIMNTVENTMNYSGIADVTVEITSVEFYIKDNSGDYVKRATIYNTESEEYDDMQDDREQFQNFTSGALKINILFDGGSGTVDDPYQISCVRHLKNINKNTAVSDEEPKRLVVGNYILTANISLSGYWTPIASEQDCFDGSIDGNNKTISNIKINISDSTAETNIGFIKQFYGTVKDLTLSNVNITGSVNNDKTLWVGAFAGYSRYLNIENCKVSGTINVKGNSVNMGGFTGQASNISAQSCVNNIKLTGTGTVGGLVGVVNRGEMTECLHNGSIYGGLIMGGITGVAEYTEFRNCEVNGIVQYNTKITDHDCIGGLVGRMYYGKIRGCDINVAVNVAYKEWDSRTYQPYVGGFVGNLIGGDFDDLYYGNTPISPDVSNLNEDVTWWSWGTKHFNQKLYCAKYVGNPAQNYVD